ncbi:WbqC family protein [Sinorhizobium fredii]|uniref:WbqC family protein n=1 Tax=Rhizobium fredii TaxID=380 RepID=UPI0018658F76
MGEAEQKVRLVVQQPQFLPWIGFWHKLVSCDRWVIYAASQFQKHGHENRVTLDGGWLTIPVRRTGLDTLVMDAKIENVTACRKIARTLRQRCGSRKHAHRDRLDGVIGVLETWRSDWLIELTTELMLRVMEALGLQREVHLDTTIRAGSAIEKLDDCIAQYAPGCLYLSGRAGLDYMGFGSLWAPVETRFQKMLADSSPDSIVQLIAEHPQPLEVIRDCALWQTKEGDFYGWDNRTRTGAGAACR